MEHIANDASIDPFRHQSSPSSPYNKVEKRLCPRVKTAWWSVRDAISGLQIYKFSKNESKSMKKPGLQEIRIIDFELKPTQNTLL